MRQFLGHENSYPGRFSKEFRREVSLGNVVENSAADLLGQSGDLSFDWSITDNSLVHLFRRWGAPIGITRQIAEGAKGNVRAAMADLEMWLG